MTLTKLSWPKLLSSMTPHYEGLEGEKTLFSLNRFGQSILSQQKRNKVTIFGLESGTGAKGSYQDLVPSTHTQHWLPGCVQAVTTEEPCAFLNRYYPSVNHVHTLCAHTLQSMRAPNSA